MAAVSSEDESVRGRCLGLASVQRARQGELERSGHALGLELREGAGSAVEDL